MNVVHQRKKWLSSVFISYVLFIVLYVFEDISSARDWYTTYIRKWQLQGMIDTSSGCLPSDLHIPVGSR